MKVVINDGGRAAAGIVGQGGDCVLRSIAIATGQPYMDVHAGLSKTAASMRQTKAVRGSNPRTGVFRQVYDRYLRSLGWEWVPTMGIGTGCTVHLADGELPMGRLIVRLSKHLTAVVDGVIHDTHDPQRTSYHYKDNVLVGESQRCVYGYYRQAVPA